LYSASGYPEEVSFRFTLFNGCTLLVMAMTIAALVRRFQVPAGSNWPLVYYGVLLGYAFGFKYSLSPYWVVAGLAVALAQRLPRLAFLRCAELVVLVYVSWRCLELLLGL
jgi:hypothetical protein